jgi:hypothetical protein
LFLVASGTASSSHTGLVSQNFSVKDPLSTELFVYYFGDPDGAGVGLWTALDNGDSASNVGIVNLNKDNDTSGNGDFDYYNNPTAHANAASTAATASNTALRLVTNIAPQIWEFHLGNIDQNVQSNWSAVNARATDKGLWGSNTSRLPSMAEAIALYAANFGGNIGGGSGTTVGALEPLSNENSNNGYNTAQDNRPAGMNDVLWTAAPTPSGHAVIVLSHGHAGDNLDSNLFRYAAVL